jgi:N-acetylglutamate synthase-like GNAT family acetyltransferase
MTTRLLPPEEWARLAGTELDGVWANLPASARVVVVEDEEGRIVGCWSLFSVLHVEGVWIAPEHRGRSAVARRLLVGMRHQARDMGASGVCTAAVSDDVRALLDHLGAARVPGDHYVMSV